MLVKNIKIADAKKTATPLMIRKSFLFMIIFN